MTPYPLYSTMPNKASTWAFSAGWSGAPDEEMIRRAGNLRVVIPFIFAYSASNPNIPGAPSMTVNFAFSRVERAATGSKREAIYKVAPLNNEPSNTTESPTACDIGSTPYRRSSGFSERILADTAATKSRLRWVSMTPLGRPVVPEV